MMLDPRFETCLRAGRSGSITRAAEELFLSKQAAKKQIDSLEAELGFPLFVRSSHFHEYILVRCTATAQ